MKKSKTTKKAKKTSSRKTASRKRKPIMRHSREGVAARSRKRLTKRTSAARPKRKAATATPVRRAAKTKAAPSKRAAKPKAKPKPSASRPPSRRRGLPASWESDRRLSARSASRGIGAAAAGQSGDLEDISRDEDVDSESVEELLEEGQAFEAGVIEGVEDADEDLDEDEETDEVQTREVPMDDVPKEYLGEEEEEEE